MGLLNNRRAKLALVAFAGFLVLLIVLADLGRGGWLFRLAGLIPGGDKTGHFVLFGILSFLVNLVMRFATFQLGRMTVMKGNLLLLAIVSLEELSQLLFKSRSFDLFDLVADVAGIWAFGWLAQYYWRQKPGLAVGRIATFSKPDTNALPKV